MSSTHDTLTQYQRKDMFSKPQVPLIDQLHQYGRELAVMKRMYQSYAHIIERILARQRPINTATAVQSGKAGNHIKHMGRDSNTSAEFKHQAKDLNVSTDNLAVPLSSTATVRFERLLDRINHLALNEIQECLDEKESLVFLVHLTNAALAFHADTRYRISTSWQ